MRIDDNSFICLHPGCSKTFSRRQSAHTHFYRAHCDGAKADKGLSLYCDQCFKHFTTKRGLNLHKKTHNEEAITYQCDICYKILNTSRGYAFHMERHIGLGIICQYCEKHFTCKDSLTRHQKLHCSGKEQQEGFVPSGCVCEVCGERYKSKTSLKDHMEGVHEQHERYKCTCGKSFRWRSSLRTHKANVKCQPIVHSEEEPTVHSEKAASKVQCVKSQSENDTSHLLYLETQP